MTRGLARKCSSPPDYESIKETIDNSLDRIIGGEKARIWFDHCAYSICDFYYFVSLLPLNVLDITVVCLHEHPLLSKKYSGLDSIEGYDFLPDLLTAERYLSLAERNEITKKWNELEKTDFPLRAYVNGRLIGVPVDFYDRLILSFIPKKKDFRAEDVERKVISNGAIPFYDIALWRISAILRERKYKYDVVQDLAIPIRGIMFHN